MIFRSLIVALLTVCAANASGLSSSGQPHTCADPPAVLQLGYEGAVALEFTITEQGNVTDPSIIGTSGYPELDAAALACVATWRYGPATRNGVPIAERRKAKVLFESPAQRELTTNAWLCIRQTAATVAVAPGFAGTTQLLIRIPTAGAAQVSIFASSGNSLLDNLAADCYRKSVPLSFPSPNQQSERNYHFYIPWDYILSTLSRATSK